jgi:hypothetical protein
MVWKAKTDIGDYKAGDIVPDKIAETWNKMYQNSPVEKIDNLVSVKAEDVPKIEEKVKEYRKDLMDDGKRNYSTKKRR